MENEIIIMNADMNMFLGIPEFVWNLIFTLATTLIGGIIVASFTSIFLKKKEERTRVAGVILEKRIASEKKILTFLVNSFSKEEIPCTDKKMINILNTVISKYPKITRLQYSSVFLSYENFLKFYNEFITMYDDNHLWLDEKVRDHLLLMQGYFSWINLIPEIISKVELPNRKIRITEDEFEEACNKSFMLYGIILDNEINGLIAELDTKIVESIYKLKLNTPRKSSSRNGMLNYNTKKIIKELNYHTILGIERETMILLVVQITLRVCKIDANKISEKEMKNIIANIL